MQRPNGESEFVEPIELVWIIGYDDENELYRCFCPRYCSKKEGILLYISYEVGNQAVYWSNQGETEGDLNSDGHVDIFDLGIMKGLLISNEEDTLSYDQEEKLAMADVTRDGELSVTDVIWLQKWLLGLPVEHYPLK